MKDILAKAEELGRMIGESDRLKNLDAARKEADAEPGLQQDVKSLNDMSEKIGRLQAEGKPVEPEDKRRLRDLQEKVTSHAKIQQLARAEADFSELMNRVNRAIRTAMHPSQGQ